MRTINKNLCQGLGWEAVGVGVLSHVTGVGNVGCGTYGHGPQGGCDVPWASLTTLFLEDKHPGQVLEFPRETMSYLIPSPRMKGGREGRERKERREGRRKKKEPLSL